MYFITTAPRHVGGICHDIPLIIVGLGAIFVSDMVYTSCNLDFMHDCLRVISIASFKHCL